MELLLWRHAEAVEAEAGHPDLKRRLTSRGEKQAQHIARWLSVQQPKHLRILVSPAIRCQQALYFAAQSRVAATSSIQNRGPVPFRR